MIPNIITGIRIAVSAALLFCEALTPAFYILYSAAGLSDIADGAVARKTNTVSDFGARFDTAADIVFAAVCLIKLLPVTELPVGIYIWIGAIALIRLANITAGFVLTKKLTAVHSVLNKAAGILCFAFPLSMELIPQAYSAAAVCAVSTAAAVWESVTVIRSARPDEDQIDHI